MKTLSEAGMYPDLYLIKKSCEEDPKDTELCYTNVQILPQTHLTLQAASLCGSCAS